MNEVKLILECQKGEKKAFNELIENYYRGSVQSKNNVYCLHCGKKLNETCKECGAIIDIKANYCSKCGKKQ